MDITNKLTTDLGRHLRMDTKKDNDNGVHYQEQVQDLLKNHPVKSKEKEKFEEMEKTQRQNVEERKFTITNILSPKTCKKPQQKPPSFWDILIDPEKWEHYKTILEHSNKDFPRRSMEKIEDDEYKMLLTYIFANAIKAILKIESSQLVTDPNYTETMRKMLDHLDSLYKGRNYDMRRCLLRAKDWEYFKDTFTEDLTTCVWTGKDIYVGEECYTVAMWSNYEGEQPTVFHIAECDDEKHPKKYLHEFLHFARVQRFRLYIQHHVEQWAFKNFKTENKIQKDEGRVEMFLATGKVLIFNLICDFLFSRKVITLK